MKDQEERRRECPRTNSVVTQHLDERRGGLGGSGRERDGHREEQRQRQQEGREDYERGSEAKSSEMEGKLGEY